MLAVLLAAVAWVAVRGIGAGMALAAAARDADTLRATVAAARLDDITGTLKRIEANVENARSLTSDPVWRTAEHVPWLGGDLRAVREVSEVSDDVVQRGLVPLLEGATRIDVNTVGISRGRIDIAALQDAAVPLADAAAALGRAERAARGIRPSGVIAPLDAVVDDLLADIRTTSQQASKLSAAAQLLPTMVGSSSPRHYLLVVQDAASLRSSGGRPAVLAVLTARGGAVSLSTPVSAAGVRVASKPVAALPAAVSALFGSSPGVRIQSALSAPDFPTGAALASAIWTSAEGGRIDGVIAIDGTVLADLVAVTGAMDVAGVTVTPDDAAETVLRASHANGTADALWRGLTAKLFATLTSASADAEALPPALAAAEDAGRVRVWSANRTEQAILRATPLSGALPADDAHTAHVAVLLNDTTGAAMDTYARAAVDASVGSCRADGRTQLRVAVAFSNTAPADAADSLPVSVTGKGTDTLPRGTMGTRVAVVGPVGWTASAGTATGEAGAPVATTADGRPIVQLELHTPPASDQRVVVEFTSAGDDTPAIEVSSTPMITSTPISTGALTCG